MKPSNLAVGALLSMLCGYLSSAQDGKRYETIDYPGVKFLPVHWILSVSDHGKTVILEDSSVWRICPYTCTAACRLWPGSMISIEDRGDTYRYTYRLVVSYGNRSYSLNALCVKVPRERDQVVEGGIYDR